MSKSVILLLLAGIICLCSLIFPIVLISPEKAGTCLVVMVAGFFLSLLFSAMSGYEREKERNTEYDKAIESFHGFCEMMILEKELPVAGSREWYIRRCTCLLVDEIFQETCHPVRLYGAVQIFEALTRVKQ